ncbi:MAG: UDP-N-acetylmuramoyl-L-alanyl-D-glutamate--2,6-diaminopimelate ligase [Clostridia bacterium]|nr:UDP-N-acetylmuramoyl-L-alanyl-D-glutamate--2,6-diaminopimelate ligase [Clostridia bacterium]
MLFNEIFNNVDFYVENSFKDSLNNIEISDIIYDSRKIVKNCIFVCLCGSNVDGHKFAKQAVKDGAVCIVSQKELDITDVPVILVDDTRYTLSLISANFFKNPANELKTIGITGTKGKTTTACMIKSIMEQSGSKVGLIGTLGVVIGDKIYKTNNTTPESYQVQYYMRKMIQEGCDCVIMEVSSLGLKWHRVGGFVFDVAIFTNFALDHIGQNEHQTLEEYKYCKSLLFKQCKYAAVNCDDEAYKDMLKHSSCKTLTYGFCENADFRVVNEKLIYKPGYLGVGFDLISTLNYYVDVSIPGRFSVYNALAAIAACSFFNIDKDSVQNGLKNVTVKGRVEIVKTPGDYTLLIDYAHNALSMQNILSTLREYNPNRLICLFGAGGNRAKSRRYEMGDVCGRLADLSVITADNSRFENVFDIINDIKIGMKDNLNKSITIPDRKDAIKYVIDNAQKHDIIVLAGKGHEDYQEINGVKFHFDEREIIKNILNNKE